MSSLPNFRLLSPSVQLLAMIFSMGVALGSGLNYGFSQAALDSKQQQQSTQTDLRRVGRTEYEQLKTGMSLTEVRAILNQGIEVSRSTTTATFVWENPDKSKITVTFEGDRLKNKEQSGLK